MKLFNFFENKEPDVDDVPDNRPHYLGLEDDKINRLNPVERETKTSDDFSFNLTEEDLAEDSVQQPNMNEQPDNSETAKKYILIGFAGLSILIIASVILTIIFAGGKQSKNTDNKSNTEDQSAIDGIDSKNSNESSDEQTTSKMFGAGSFKVYDKKTDYYTATNVAEITNNANETLKAYYSSLKSIEASKMVSYDRTSKIDEMITTASYDLETLDIAKPAFEKFESGTDIYINLKTRFTELQKLFKEVQYKSSGSESATVINKYITTDNESLSDLKKILKSFSVANSLIYKENQNKIIIEN